MNDRVGPLYEITALNTRLFRNTLSGVDDASAQSRPGPEGNNMAFIAAHLLDARAWLVRYLGGQYQHPFANELAGVTSIDDMERFPALDSIVAAWNEVSEHLRKRLVSLTDEEIERQSEQEFPIDDLSVLGGIAFMLQHESFHIGQLALIRRLLGFGAMSYSEQ